ILNNLAPQKESEMPGIVDATKDESFYQNYRIFAEKPLVRPENCIIEGTPRMKKVLPLTLFSLGCAALFPATASALSMSMSPPRSNPQPSKFVFKDASGKAASVDVVQSY